MLTASGNSPNILRAVRAAKRRGASTIGIIGFGGGRVRRLVDVSVVIAADKDGDAEDVQTVIHHLMSQFMLAKLKTVRSGT